MANEENLRPFQPGVSGNPSGRPKGSRNVSTIIRETLENPPDWGLVPTKSKKLKGLFPDKSGWEVITYVALAKAMDGDIKAMSWLSKTGYGSKVEIAPERLPIPILAGLTQEEVEPIMGGSSIVGLKEPD